MTMQEAPGQDGGGPVVLVVDDEPDVLETLQRLVGRGIKDATIKTAPDGLHALRLLDEGPVDIIVSDYKMPEMDGIEFLHWASRTHPEARRVMLTAFADDEAVRKALAEAFVDCLIPKTTPPAVLLQQIQDILDSPRRIASTAA